MTVVGPIRMREPGVASALRGRATRRRGASGARKACSPSEQVRTAAPQPATSRCCPCRASHDLVDLPLPGHALQLAAAAGLEAEPGADRKIVHRARGEDLAAVSEVADAGGNVDTDAADVVADELDLAGVCAGPDLDSERGCIADDRVREVDGAARPVEGDEEAVTVVLISRPRWRSSRSRTSACCCSSRSRSADHRPRSRARSRRRCR